MNFTKKFPNYDVSRDGTIYKNNIPIKPFKSNKYLQVLLFDKNHKRYILGVHVAVAMKYLKKYHKGCIVHHKDGNTHNNNVNNLEIMGRSDHSRQHGKLNTAFIKMNKGKPAWNKGMKMSEEFRQHCREGAKKRHKKKTLIPAADVD